METITTKIDWENGCDECWTIARERAQSHGIDLDKLTIYDEPFQIPADCYFPCTHDPAPFAPAIFLEPGSFDLDARNTARD